MERGSTKHGPRLDDEMRHEVDGVIKGGLGGGRAEEYREPEPAGDDQPQPHSMPAGVENARMPTSDRPVRPEPTDRG
ncbi:MAG TPA: hypothetical protein VFY17_06130 [Pilimelia sp.]|nr:hypothetical protein [Pilimelia sp.]